MNFLQLSKIIALFFFVLFSSNVSASEISCDDATKYFDDLPLDIYGHFSEIEDYTNNSMYIDSIFNGSCVSVETIVEKFALSGARRYNCFDPTYEQNMFALKITLFVEKNNIEIINILKEKDKDFIYNFFRFIKTPMNYIEEWPPGIQEKDKFPEFPEKYDKNIRKILYEVENDIKKGICK